MKYITIIVSLVTYVIIYIILFIEDGVGLFWNLYLMIPLFCFPALLGAILPCSIYQKIMFVIGLLFFNTLALVPSHGWDIFYDFIFDEEIRLYFLISYIATFFIGLLCVYFFRFYPNRD